MLGVCVSFKVRGRCRFVAQYRKVRPTSQRSDQADDKICSYGILRTGKIHVFGISCLTLPKQTMLSAVLQLLQSIVHDTAKDRRLSILELCAAAFPDVQPWQVRKTSAAIKENEEQESLYYRYLSLLLHPIDGNEMARRDADLVKVRTRAMYENAASNILSKEWCRLSIEAIRRNGDPSNQDFLSNFLSVASKASSDHLVYHRDLPFLLDQAMLIKENNLVLDLCKSP